MTPIQLELVVLMMCGVWIHFAVLGAIIYAIGRDASSVLECLYGGTMWTVGAGAALSIMMWIG